MSRRKPAPVRGKQGRSRFEDVRGDNEATWAARRALVLGPNIRENAFLKELERWRWDVVRSLVNGWDAPWQDAEDAYSAYLLDVCCAIAGRPTSRHTSREKLLAAPRGKSKRWLPFLVCRARNRLRERREDHVPVSHTDVDGPNGDGVAIVDHRHPAPGAALEAREDLDGLLGLLRHALAGRRGSEIHFRVIAGRMLGLDYSEIGLRLQKSAAGCRVAFARALKRLPKWLLDRLGERRRPAA